MHLSNVDLRKKTLTLVKVHLVKPYEMIQKSFFVCVKRSTLKSVVIFDASGFYCSYNMILDNLQLILKDTTQRPKL